MDNVLAVAAGWLAECKRWEVRLLAQIMQGVRKRAGEGLGAIDGDSKSNQLALQGTLKYFRNIFHR